MRHRAPDRLQESPPRPGGYAGLRGDGEQGGATALPRRTTRYSGLTSHALVRIGSTPSGQLDGLLNG